MIDSTSTNSLIAHAGLRDRNPWVVLGLLTAIMIICTVDRVLPQMMAESIKSEFGLSDSALGLLIGTSYGISSAIAMVVIGPIIDRANRRWLLGSLLTIWSLLTFISGLAPTVFVLMIARMSVGAAEAGAMPISLALISDFFGKDRRSTAIGLFKVSGTLGYMTASALVGIFLVDHGWRGLFMIAGAPGLVLAILFVWYVREPKRGRFDTGAVADGEPVPYLVALNFIAKHPALAPTLLAIMILATVGSGIASFSVIFFQRSFGISAAQASFYFAMASAIGGISPLLFGMISDKLMQRGAHAPFTFFSVLTALAVLFTTALVFAPNQHFAFAALILCVTIIWGYSAPVYSLVLTLTKAGMRGTVASIFLIASLAIPTTLGALGMGVLSDTIGGKSSVGSAMLVMMSVGGTAAATLFWMAGRNLRSSEALAASG